MCRLFAADTQGIKNILQITGNHALTEQAGLILVCDAVLSAGAEEFCHKVKLTN